jgi:flagellar hook protein FlgE
MMINTSSPHDLMTAARMRLDTAAAAMAGKSIETTDVARTMVDMMTATKEIKIAVSTVRTQDEMLGSLIDIKA